MEANKDIKLKIASIVAAWEMENFTEFNAFLAARKVKTDTLRDKFAEMPGGGYIMRLLYEIPEGLDSAFTRVLDVGEKEFLASTKGAQWFAKTFKQYNVSQKT